MFNPPAALLSARTLAGEEPRRRSRQARPVLDDPWRDPLSSAPALPQPAVRPRHRRAAWVGLALVAPARRPR
jgi:hypothetical protein